MKFAKLALGASAVVLFSLATKNDAEADYTVAAYAGKAAWAADQGCFQDDYGGAGNYWCSSAKTYVVYLPTSAQFAHSQDILVSVYQPNTSNPISCSVNIMGMSHTLVYSTAW